jgi:tetratricopeptide (TPR) repeat protein
MLPPREVPAGLSESEYLILTFRYQVLVWPRQMAKCQKFLLNGNSAAQTMSEEGRKRTALLMSAFETTYFVHETVNMVQDTATDIVKLAATGVGEVMDKNPVTAKAKKGAILAAGMAKFLAEGAMHKVVSGVVLPSVGLPTDFVPPGREPEHYLAMARRYEQFGFPEAERMALERAIEADKAGTNAARARVLLRTRVPKEHVPDAAGMQYVQGLKNYVIKDYEGARAIFEVLVRDYPNFEWGGLMLARTLIYLGEIERAQDLAMMVYRYNPNILGAHLVLASIDVVAWRIKLLEERLEKIRALDPLTPELAPFESLMQHISEMGLRR